MNVPATATPWWQRHWRALLGVVVGYGALLVGLAVAGQGSKWIDATTAYFLIANLVVLWWYADTTRHLLEASRQQITVSERQHAVAWRTHREANKPFVVVERIEDALRGYHYYLRNIGPGIAVNVWLVQLTPDGQLTRQPLGPMAPQASKLFSGAVEEQLCNQDGLFPFALFAEALITRTAQWNVTVNVRERRRGGEMRSAVFPIEPRDESRTIEEVLGPVHGAEWHRIERGLHDIGAGL